MGKPLRSPLSGLLAMLFALAVLAVPAQHARMEIEAATFRIAFAMPDGTLPQLCLDGHDGQDPGDRHAVSPSCLACVLMAAPGVALAPPAVAARTVTPVAADLAAADEPATARRAATARHARAPPIPSLA